MEEETVNGGLVKVEREVSEIIGPLPKIAPKKHRMESSLWLRCGKVECGAAEDRYSNGAYCPRVSVVMGDVIDIGESAWRFRNGCTDIPFERVSKTTYPMRHLLSQRMAEEPWSHAKQKSASSQVKTERRW